MFKKGFTLQEVLITMAIIGVVTALTIPAMYAKRPNKNKMKFLNAYNVLATITNDSLRDSSYYWIEGYDPTTGLPNCHGLQCRSTQTKDCDMLKIAHPELDGSACGKYKFARIFMSKVNNLQENSDIDESTVRFTTADNVEWTIEDAGETINITIDVNAANNSSTYSDSKLEKVDAFDFKIDTATGSIRAESSSNGEQVVAKDYLAHPNQINQTKLSTSSKD